MSNKDDLTFLDSGQDDDVLFDKADSQTHTFTNFPNSAVDDEELGDDGDKSQLLKDEKKAAPSFWTFEYYQQFFDVETRQVAQRVAGSMMPLPNKNYLQSHIRPNPDLYGPFWICTTLVFTTAIAGNLANYLSSGGVDYQWKYDFHKVTFAATAIFSYWWVLPAALYGLLWWRKSEAGYTFLEILCVYGYSLAIYIPISILWVINITWLQWLLVVVGAVLSGGVLVLTMWPAVKDDAKNVAFGVAAVVFIFHLLLAAGFVMYFFHVPAVAVPPSNINTTPAPKMQVPENLKQQKPVESENKQLVENQPAQDGIETVDTNKNIESQAKLKDNKVTQKPDSVESVPVQNEAKGTESDAKLEENAGPEKVDKQEIPLANEPSDGAKMT